MLALPTFVWSAVSRKCVGSLLVRVSVGLAGVEGGAAPKLMPPGMIALFPAIVLIIFMGGAVTVVTICTGTSAGVL